MAYSHNSNQVFSPDKYSDGDSIFYSVAQFHCFKNTYLYDSNVHRNVKDCYKIVDYFPSQIILNPYNSLYEGDFSNYKLKDFAPEPLKNDLTSKNIYEVPLHGNNGPYGHTPIYLDGYRKIIFFTRIKTGASSESSNKYDVDLNATIQYIVSSHYSFNGGGSQPEFIININADYGFKMPYTYENSISSREKGNKLITTKHIGAFTSWTNTPYNQMYSDNYASSRFNGNYITFEKINVSNELDKIIGKNTKLNSVFIIYDIFGHSYAETIPFSKFEKVDDLTYKYETYFTSPIINTITNHSITIYLRFSQASLCDKSNSIFYYNYCINDLIKNNKTNKNMLDGFVLEVNGLQDNDDITLNLEYETDLEKVRSELGSAYVNNKSTKIKFASDTFSDLTYKSVYSQSFAPTVDYDILADLSVKKEITPEKDDNTNSNSINTVTAKVGYSDTEYVDIHDFIDSYGNIDSAGHKSNLIKDKNSLLNLRKYLSINDFSITENINGTSRLIYSNNKFIDEYSNSTLNIGNDTALYDLHLIKNNEKISSLTEYKITYNLKFNPNLNNNSFRDDKNYNGQQLFISTNAKATRNYDGTGSGDTEKSTEEGKYKNYIDADNKQMICYAASETGSIGSTYLKFPEIEKNSTLVNNLTSSKYMVSYHTNTTGTNKTTSMDAKDTITFSINSKSKYVENVQELAKNYIKYKNIKIYLNDTNSTPIFTYDNILKDDIQITGTYTGKIYDINNNSFNIVLNNLNYNDTVYVEYNTDFDYDAFMNKLISEKIINKEYKFTDTSEEITILFKNDFASNDSNYKNISNSSESKIELHDVLPGISKNKLSVDNDNTKWEIDINTGITGEELHINDIIDIESTQTNNIELFKNNLITNNLSISINNEDVFINGKLIDKYKDNIVITKNKYNTYDFVFKDSTTNKFIKNNSKIVIKYNTLLSDKLNITTGEFKLINKASLTKGKYNFSDEDSANINFNFPVEATKEFIGMSDDKLSSNYKITINTGHIKRHNFSIKDIITPKDDIKKYLSISNIKITENEKVIYDNLNNINSLNAKLLDGNSNKLVFNKDGIFNFNLVYDEIAANTSIVIEYSIRFDKYEYSIYNDINDEKFILDNKLNIDDQENDSKEILKTGYIELQSLMKKSYKFLEKVDGYDYLEWNTSLNLLSKYSLDELKNSNVVLSDDLDKNLELIEDSIVVRDSKNNILDKNAYIISYVDNKLTIKINDPSKYNNINMTFNTKVISSTLDIVNNLDLKINDQTYTVKSNSIQFLKVAGITGNVSADEILSYTINCKKMLDNKDAKIPFKFILEEVDSSGKILENGFLKETINDEFGNIEFSNIIYN